jgi:biotin carboxyl carrier protein
LDRREDEGIGMRFLARSLVGLLLAALTLGLIGYGGWRLAAAIEAQREGAPPSGPAEERVFAVQTFVPEATTLRPVLRAYGEIASARRLELRPARAGRLVELSPAFIEGGAVEKGDLLFRVDPAPARSELERARIARDDAEAELADARRAEDLAARDLAAARDQRDLRRRALGRQEDLRARGVGTEAAVEEAGLALSAARQQVIAREKAQADADARTDAARIALRRAELEVADAERALAETAMHAPYAGLLTEVQAVPGRRVSANEKLGVLVDLSRLEAAFRVSNAEYARLLNDAGALPPHPASVSLDLGGAEAALPARLARAGAAAGSGRTGRTLFARLEPEAGGLLREGDFVSIQVAEPPLDAVAVLPAAAATEDGRILTVTPDDRLAERRVSILRRMGDELVIAEVPEAPVVAVRTPRLGPGVKVETLERPAPEPPTLALAPQAETAPQELVALDDDRRARLMGLVESDAELADADRARLIDWLSAPRAPRSVIERLESRADASSGG